MFDFITNREILVPRKSFFFVLCLGSSYTKTRTRRLSACGSISAMTMFEVAGVGTRG